MEDNSDSGESASESSIRKWTRILRRCCKFVCLEFIICFTWSLCSISFVVLSVLSLVSHLRSAPEEERDFYYVLTSVFFILTIIWSIVLYILWKHSQSRRDRNNPCTGKKVPKSSEQLEELSTQSQGAVIHPPSSSRELSSAEEEINLYYGGKLVRSRSKGSPNRGRASHRAELSKQSVKYEARTKSKRLCGVTGQSDNDQTASPRDSKKEEERRKSGRTNLEVSLDAYYEQRHSLLYTNITRRMRTRSQSPGAHTTSVPEHLEDPQSIGSAELRKRKQVDEEKKGERRTSPRKPLTKN